ncbi:hypothetical protein ACFSL4_01510 [Streptomyces caeni]|uniref:Uncharacterized protein n=1 Tax=Streptomyces caeni TaxID=2307231 RepID=A0ABW4IJ78_9ACTN
MSAHTSVEYVLDESRRRALSDDLRRMTGYLLAEVRVTRTQWQDGPRWVVLALAVDEQPPFGHREIPLVEGDNHRQIAGLLQAAFPAADWDRAQDYHVTDGILREHLVRLPASLRGDAL